MMAVRVEILTIILSLNPIYTPPAGYAGSITLTLTAVGNANCSNANDLMTLTLTASPTVDAGSNEETCQDVPFDLSSSTVTPSASEYSALSWDDGGAGGNFDDNTSLNPIYTPPAGYVGNITLTLTATGNSSCADVSDNMNLSVVLPPSANAGTDEETCQDSTI